MRFCYSVLIGNLFGRAVLGAVNAGISTALFASLLLPSAAAMSATKYVARSRGAGDLDGARSALAHLGRGAAAASVLIGVTCVAVAGPLLHLSLTESVLTGALAVSYSGYTFIRGALFGLGMVARATVWDGISTIVSVLGLAAVLVAGAPPWLLLPLVIGYGVYVVANWPPSTGQALPQPLKREMNAFLMLTLINSVATGGFLQLSMVGAQHWDPLQAGSFAAALALATPASLVSRSVSLVLFPNLAAAHGRGDTASAHRQTDIATRGLVVLSLAVFGPLMLMSPAIISLFFSGPQFRQAATLLPVLLGAVMVLNMVIGATNTLLTREHRFSKIVVWGSVVGAVGGIAWWVLFAPDDGVSSIAWGYLGGSLIIALVPTVAVWHLDRQRWAGLAGRFVGGCAAVIVGVWWTDSRAVSAVGQIAMAVVFTSAWLAIGIPDAKRLLAARS